MPFWFLNFDDVMKHKGKFPCHLQFGICILHVPDDPEKQVRYWNGRWVSLDEPLCEPKLYRNTSGLAKALEGSLFHGAKLTAVGHRVGTPRYMSPEMARGEESDEACDLYALALVIGEMLTSSGAVT